MPKISGKLLLVDSEFLPRIADAPKNPSNLPQNRFKCFRRIFDVGGKNNRSTVP